MGQKLKRRFVIIPLGAVVFMAVAVLGVRLTVRSTDTDFVDFATLEHGSTYYHSEACPASFCPALPIPDFQVEPVAFSPADLTKKIEKLSQVEPRVSLVARDDLNGRFVLVQRSLSFGFPDIINIRVRPTIDGLHCFLWIHSRSNYGSGNESRERVRRWLKLLDARYLEIVVH